MRKLLIPLLLSLVCSGMPAQESSEYVWPGEKGWKDAKPDKYGFSAQKLKGVREFVINKTKGTGMMIIVGGECIFKYGHLTKLSYLASCRKSVLAMLYGKYVENGTIDLDKTVGELGIDDTVEPGFEVGLLPSEKEATVRDLITARSGVYHVAAETGDSNNRPARGSKPHGTYYLYNNWDFNVAGECFERMTGKNIYDALGEDIAIPIGMQDWDRSAQHKSADRPDASLWPAYHFYLSTRDMARLGYLMLREGRWKDQQVIPASWVKTITSEVTSWEEVNDRTPDRRYSYGYMWWLFDQKDKRNGPELKGAYTAWGAMGQYITVVPELDMVIAFKTDAEFGRKTRPARYLELLQLVLDAKGE